jgi:hypothetical protein
LYGTSGGSGDLYVFTANQFRGDFLLIIDIPTTTINIKIRALSFDAPW